MVYDDKYFITGKQNGISNYVDYRWMPDRTIPFAEKIIGHLGIKREESFLDFGCARGYTVKAMLYFGVNATGYDISEWAIQNCDPDVAGKVSSVLPESTDWILAKDVLEHIPHNALFKTTSSLIKAMRKGMLIIVPLSTYLSLGKSYLRYEDNQDMTHITKWPLESWMYMLTDVVYESGESESVIVSGTWHIPGLKPTSLNPYRSCGFITLSRIAPH